MKMCEWYILITHDNCTCIFHDLSKLFSSAHEVYRFRRALPCFYPGKVTVTIIRSKRGGMFKMLLWDFWQRMGHELINIHLGTDDSPFVVRPWLHWSLMLSNGLLHLFLTSDINECDSNPCQHEGTCFNFIDLYECQCPPSFTGTNCEIGKIVWLRVQCWQDFACEVSILIDTYRSLLLMVLMMLLVNYKVV